MGSNWFFVVIFLGGWYWFRRQRYLKIFLWEKIDGCVRETAEGDLFRDTELLLSLLQAREYRKIEQLKNSELRWQNAAQNLRNTILTAHLGIKREQRIKFFHLNKW